MNADVKGALAQLNQSYKAFTHNGYKMSKEAVKKVLEYAVVKGYEHTGQIRDAEIDAVLTKGTTVEQWERYYEDLKRHEDICKREKPHPEDFNDLNGGEAAYTSAHNKWLMMWSCDAPNKPGYYRANND